MDKFILYCTTLINVSNCQCLDIFKDRDRMVVYFKIRLDKGDWYNIPLFSIPGPNHYADERDVDKSLGQFMNRLSGFLNDPQKCVFNVREVTNEIGPDY